MLYNRFTQLYSLSNCDIGVFMLSAIYTISRFEIGHKNIGQVKQVVFQLLYLFTVLIRQLCKHCHSESIHKKISNLTYKALEQPLPQTC